jgi:uncharacterized membrane protein YtjA (UPF0391 family)
MSYAQAGGPLTAIANPVTDTDATPSELLKKYQVSTMLYYAAVFFVIALIAAFFGFGGIAVGAASIAKILFVVFLIVAAVTFLISLGRRV